MIINTAAIVAHNDDVVVGFKSTEKKIIVNWTHVRSNAKRHHIYTRTVYEDHNYNNGNTKSTKSKVWPIQREKYKSEKQQCGWEVLLASLPNCVLNIYKVFTSLSSSLNKNRQDYVMTIR